MNQIDSIAVALISILTLLYFYRIRMRHVFLAIAIVLGLFNSYLDLISLVSMALLCGTLYLSSYHKKLPRRSGQFFCVALGLALSFHMLPGFHNIKVIDSLFLSPDTVPYTMYFNLDKQLAALAFLELLTFNRGMRSLRRGLKGFLVFAVPVALILIGAGYSLAWLRWEPKVPSFLALWMLKNLLFTCVSEEVFFRGFIQSKALATGTKYSSYLVIGVVGVLFGLVHFQGGLVYVVLASIAGFIYGLAAYRLKSLEAAIFTHFTVNLIHIVFFTYPRLA